MDLFHLTYTSDWDPDAETYRLSTHGRTIDEVGFLHASKSRDQLDRVAGTFFAGVSDPLTVLVLSEETLAEHGLDVRLEPVDPSDPDSETFPHVYGGNLPTAAVIDTFPTGGSRRAAGGDTDGRDRGPTARPASCHGRREPRRLTSAGPRHPRLGSRAVERDQGPRRPDGGPRL